MDLSEENLLTSDTDICWKEGSRRKTSNENLRRVQTTFFVDRKCQNKNGCDATMLFTQETRQSVAFGCVS